MIERKQIIQDKGSGLLLAFAWKLFFNLHHQRHFYNFKKIDILSLVS